MKLYINTELDPQNSLVTSQADNNQKSIPTLFLGDAIPLVLSFTDNTGGFAYWQDEQDIKVTVGIGVLATNRIYAFQDKFEKKLNGFHGTLVLHTENLANDLAGSESLSAILEVQVNRGNGQSLTTLQTTVNIKNQLLDHTTSHPTSLLVDSDNDNTPDLYDAYPLDVEEYSNIDHDSVSDADDDQPENPNVQIDTDEDGIDDSQDNDFLDHDGDGIPNSQDNDFLDHDGDGIPNSQDNDFLDDDGDGIPNSQDNDFLDDDGDGIPNSQDNDFLDHDGDGIPNSQDNDFLDHDGDGIPNSQDNDFLDHDGDGIPNSQDNDFLDDDGDGIPNSQDSDFVDSDSDGVVDSQDYFSDNSNYTMSKATLDTYVHDQYKVLAVGDIIKWLVADESIFTTGEYFIISNVTGTIEVSYSGQTYTLNEADRHIKWMIVNPVDQITPEPIVDTDNDGTQDSDDYFSNNANYTQTKAELDAYELDTHKDVENGDIIRILAEVSLASGGSLVVGDYYIVEGVDLLPTRVTITHNNEGQQTVLASRGTNWEVVNPSDQLSPDPTIDSDSDGVPDSSDYFSDNANYTMSKDVLDSYSLDPYGTVEVGDIMKVIDPFTVHEVYPSMTVEAGTYHIIESIPSDTQIQISTEGVSITLSQRAVKWELVNPADQVTPNPNADTDGDGVIDTEDYFSDNASYTQTKAELDAYAHDQYKVLAVGDIIKWLVADEGIFVTGEYYILSNVTGTIEITYQDTTYTLNESDRHVKWMVVNPSDQLTPDPTDTDSDGVVNVNEYFDVQPEYTMNQTTLDTYVNDRWKPLSQNMTGVIIKTIQPITLQRTPNESGEWTELTFPADTYFTGRLIESSLYNNGYGKIGINVEHENQLHPSELEATGRNVDWIVVNTSDALTPQPTQLPDFEVNTLLQHYDFSLTESLTFNEGKVSKAEELSNTIQTANLGVSSDDWSFVQINTNEQPSYSPSIMNNLGGLDLGDANANMQAKDLISARFASGDAIQTNASFELIVAGTTLSDGREIDSLALEERLVKIDAGEEWDGYYEMTQTSVNHYEGTNIIPEIGGSYDFYRRKYRLDGTLDLNKAWIVGRRTSQQGDMVVSNFGVYWHTSGSATPESGYTSGNYTMPHDILQLDGASSSYYATYGGANITIEPSGNTLAFSNGESFPRELQLLRIDGGDYAGYYEPTTTAIDFFNGGIVQDGSWYRRVYHLDFTSSANSYQYDIVKSSGIAVSPDQSQTEGSICKIYIRSDNPNDYASVAFEYDGSDASNTDTVCMGLTPYTFGEYFTPVDTTSTYVLNYENVDPYKFEILMVGRHNSNSLAGTNHYFDSGGIEDAPSSSTNPKHRIAVRSSNSNANIQVLSRDNVDGYTTSYNMTNINQLQPDETFILNFRNGNQSRVRINGGQAEKYGDINPVATLDNINLGNWFQDSSPMNGWVGEFIIVYRHLSANELNNIEGYLASKWGITNKLPTSHPAYA
jgi:hypothetical protein